MTHKDACAQGHCSAAPAKTRSGRRAHHTAALPQPRRGAAGTPITLQRCPSQDEERPACPSTGEWIKRRQYIYTMECYSAIKENPIMPFAATWMDLEIAMLSGKLDRKGEIL